MGKKYIIEMKEHERLYKAKLDAFNGPVIQEIAGAPYTEPDLDAIRNEAYEKGVRDTKKHWVDAPRTCAYKLGYENGLNDAWDAARKIVLDDWDEGIKDDDFYEMFNGKCYRDVLRTFTAAEAIEKLKADEEKQTRIDYNFEMIKDVIETSAKEYCMTLDEIAAVLEKMREES